MNRSFLIVLVISVSFVRVPSALAVAEHIWAVVPVTRGDLPASMEGMVWEVRRELERQGRRAWSPKAAVEEFERRSSRPSRGLTPQELEQWSRDSRAGIRYLTKGEHATALMKLERAERLSRNAREELHREPARAQQALDTCLYMVRALLETDNAVGAASYASECVRRVPRGEPAGLMHPPEVLALYHRARDAGQRETAVLVVASRPSQCEVRINGVPFGRTPLRTDELANGEYGIEVECERKRSGRVHVAELKTGEQNVFVNTEFERSVHTDPILRLEYPGDREPEWRAEDARAIAESLPAVMLVLVAAPVGGKVAIDLVSDEGTLRGCAEVAMSSDGFDAAALARAVRGLIRGQCGSASAQATQASRLFKSGI